MYLAYHENIGLKIFFHVFNIMSSSLFKYFKPLSKSSLPSPDGQLSRAVPSSSIATANQEVSKLLPLPRTVKDLPAQSVSSGTRARGTYAKFTPKQKATVGYYMEQVLLYSTSRLN